MAKEWAIGFALLFSVATLVRTVSVGKAWRPFVPGGIAVAVGKSIYTSLLTPHSHTQL
jgi:hypothetical protein